MYVYRNITRKNTYNSMPIRHEVSNTNNAPFLCHARSHDFENVYLLLWMCRSFDFKLHVIIVHMSEKTATSVTP